MHWSPGEPTPMGQTKSLRKEKRSDRQWPLNRYNTLQCSFCKFMNTFCDSCKSGGNWLDACDGPLTQRRSQCQIAVSVGSLHELDNSLCWCSWQQTSLKGKLLTIRAQKGYTVRFYVQVQTIQMSNMHPCAKPWLCIPTGISLYGSLSPISLFFSTSNGMEKWIVRVFTVRVPSIRHFRVRACAWQRKSQRLALPSDPIQIVFDLKANSKKPFL